MGVEGSWWKLYGIFSHLQKLIDSAQIFQHESQIHAVIGRSIGACKLAQLPTATP
jgi:hypothetical protein